MSVKMDISEEVLNIMEHMAKTGEGTDGCLERGFLPVPVHFYQPIPDLKDLDKRKVWDKVSTMPGIKFEPDKYWAFLSEIAENYSDECKWIEDPINNAGEFFLNNDCFGYGCSSTLHCMIRHNKPKRVIEVGSGFSSKIIKAAIAANRAEGFEAKYTVVDPYSPYANRPMPEWMTIIDKQIEVLDLDIFKELEENDILFIDSSHVCKIGSDVNYEILEILPVLNKGVLIHFHDIPMPYEYHEVYAKNPSFRVFWNESYFLQAFLQFNSDFEIILPVNYLQRTDRDRFNNIFPLGKEVKCWQSEAFWIKRIKD